jgi:hypothetical protein
MWRDCVSGDLWKVTENMSEPREVKFDDVEQAAISHAWNYFLYHAQQRQTVFNFFLILVGASVAAYASTLAKAEGSHDRFHLVLGLLVLVSSFLFWRLDKRGSRLVKLAEAPLKNFEDRLAERTGIPDMAILSKADAKFESGVLSRFESFGQIYRTVFILAGAGGLAVAALSIKRIAA